MNFKLYVRMRSSVLLIVLSLKRKLFSYFPDEARSSDFLKTVHSGTRGL
jgi:hypothetical protein